MLKWIKLKEEDRKWGSFVRFILNRPCTVKILRIKKGKQMSLQYHKLRSEFWHLIKGKVEVWIGKWKEGEEVEKGLKRRILRKGQSIRIPRMSLHTAKALEDSEILEISVGKFDEGDIIRIKIFE